MAFLVAPLSIPSKQSHGNRFTVRCAVAGALLLACISCVVYSSGRNAVSLDEEGIVDDQVYAPAYATNAASNPLYPPPPAPATQLGGGNSENGDLTGTGAGATGAAAVQADPTTAASGQDFSVADYDKLKFERRQALDFCEAHFSAFVNIQKCIFELFKNARY